VTSFINIKYGDIAVESSPDEQRAVRFFCGQKVTTPPYSPNLAPSDYHLFGPMKKMLYGQKFALDTEVQ